jgi:hypothetical protein
MLRKWQFSIPLLIKLVRLKVTMIKSKKNQNLAVSIKANISHLRIRIKTMRSTMTTMKILTPRITDLV